MGNQPISHFSPSRGLQPARLLALTSVLLLLPACATTLPGTTYPRSTRITHGDILETSDNIAAQLASSAFLRARNPGSSPITLGFGQLRNRSNERLSSMERRATVARVLLEPSMLRLLRDKNIAAVLPPARADELARFGLERAIVLGSTQPPTHAVSAEFRSLTRAASMLPGRPADTRKDLYAVDLTIVELGSGRAAWSGTHEFARAARGTLID